MSHVSMKLVTYPVGSPPQAARDVGVCAGETAAPVKGVSLEACHIQTTSRAVGPMACQLCWREGDEASCYCLHAALWRSPQLASSSILREAPKSASLMRPLLVTSRLAPCSELTPQAPGLHGPSLL